MPELNNTAPDFTLVDTEKNPVTLSSLRGQKVVLAFYPAAFTGVCSKEMCTFQSSLSEFNTLNAKVFGISVDGPFTNGAFARQNELSFSLLSDLHAKTIGDYGITLENFAGVEGYTSCSRSVFVIDENGQVVYKWTGEHNGKEPNYDDVKAALA